MTTPTERTRAVLMVAEELLRLRGIQANGKGAAVLVPRIDLLVLLACLRHYPTRADLEEAARKTPELWGKP